MNVTVIGGGLAGSEAAWQIARRETNVVIYEMRPHQQTGAHTSGDLAELVCSNSLGSAERGASGLLKQEMQTIGSLILDSAAACRVPAGGAMAVDRTAFSRRVTQCLEEHPRVTIIRKECTAIPDGPVILATGPLTSDKMSACLERITGASSLAFYDAAAPIVTGESVDYDRGFWANRYERGTPDYFNCPLNASEYLAFWQALVDAEEAPLHAAVEGDLTVFEACMPIEVMARRGVDTMRYGPLKPVGLADADGSQPYAVVQLRKENTASSLLNLVGFQTRLRWSEQRRVFRLIPALAEAEFVRYGVMHRNTFVHAPTLLRSTFQLRTKPRLFIAGQLAGVEGYAESAASGMAAGIHAVRLVQGQKVEPFAEETMIGALSHYIADCQNKNFQPMNANFGLLPPLSKSYRTRERRSQYCFRALQRIMDLKEYWK